MELKFDKSKIKGKYIQFIDRDEKTRVNKVTRISGNTFSVKDCLGRRRRVHINRVIGIIFRKKVIPLQ